MPARRGWDGPRREIPSGFVRVVTDRDTYAIRDALKARGCLWSKEDRCWVAPPDADLSQVLASAPVRKAPPSTDGWPALRGNTYPHRDALKALGGRYDRDCRCWRIPPEKLAAAKLITGAR